MTKRGNQDVDKGPTPAERAWAVVRLILGLGQMMGAVMSFYLLIATGVNELSIACVVVTCLLTTISVVLFGGRRQQK